MSATTFEYEETLDLPLDAVWNAMHRASELDIMGGQPISKRTSDVDWVTEFETSGKSVFTHCTATFDDATHTLTVMLDSDNKHAKDDTVVIATATPSGTSVKVLETIRGGLIVKGMLKLVGKGAYVTSAKNIVRNIAAIAQGGEGRALSAEEIDAAAHERLEELKKH